MLICIYKPGGFSGEKQLSCQEIVPGRAAERTISVVVSLRCFIVKYLCSQVTVFCYLFHLHPFFYLYLPSSVFLSQFRFIEAFSFQSRIVDFIFRALRSQGFRIIIIISCLVVSGIEVGIRPSGSMAV